MKKYGDETTKDLSTTIMSALETECNDGSSEKDTGLLISGTPAI